MTALVCDLAYSYLDREGERLTVELSKQRLAPGQRRAPFMTERFADLVRFMAREDIGLVDLERGRYTPFGGVRSTISAGRFLKASIDALGLDYNDFGRDRKVEPVLELRGRKEPKVIEGAVVMRAPRLPLPDTPEVRRLTEEITRINDWIWDADIQWVGEARVDIGYRHLKRIFNNGSLEQGGRLYGGFWQPISLEHRLDGILLEGERVVQLDFAQFGLRMAYAAVGSTPPPGDLYEISGLSGYRQEVKAIINALLCSEKVPTRFPQRTRGRIPRSRSFRMVYQAIARQHAPIVPLFGSGAAFRTMYLESQVAVRALLRLQAEGIVALPVHDALLVAHIHHQTAKSAMEAASEEVTGYRCEVEVVGLPATDLPGLPRG